MGVFTFVCRSSGGEWSAKQLEGEIENSATSTYELQRKLVQAATACDSSGGVTTSFSVVTPNSAVFQFHTAVRLDFVSLAVSDIIWKLVIIGAGGGEGFIGVGAAAAAPAGGAVATAEAPAAEEKKEEKEVSDEDTGFSLFD